MFQPQYKVGDTVQHERTHKLGRVVEVIKKDMEPPHEVWCYYYRLDYNPVVAVSESLLVPEGFYDQQES